MEDKLVGPHVQELEEAGAQTVYYDQALLEALSDSTPIPDSRREGIQGQDVRTLVYTSGRLNITAICIDGC